MEAIGRPFCVNVFFFVEHRNFLETVFTQCLHRGAIPNKDKLIDAESESNFVTRNTFKDIKSFPHLLSYSADIIPKKETAAEMSYIR